MRRRISRRRINPGWRVIPDSGRIVRRRGVVLIIRRWGVICRRGISPRGVISRGGVLGSRWRRVINRRHVEIGRRRSGIDRILWWCVVSPGNILINWPRRFAIKARALPRIIFTIVITSTRRATISHLFNRIKLYLSPGGVIETGVITVPRPWSVYVKPAAFPRIIFTIVITFPRSITSAHVRSGLEIGPAATGIYSFRCFILARGSRPILSATNAPNRFCCFACRGTSSTRTKVLPRRTTYGNISPI